jgi:Contractile injection system tube protein
MSDLKKATLTEISADASAKPVAGSEIAVQFNPASLKLDLTNRIEGGDTRGRQNRQYLGKTSTTLTFDLHFDTADQGTPDAPVSVRTLTAAVERFVLPKGEGNTKEKPPKARFHWA